MNRINFTQRKTKIMVLLLTVAVLIVVGVCILFFNKPNKNNIVDSLPNDEAISITDDDLQQYRQNIGDSMDIKKSILIIFNTQEECRAFINEHGSDTDPLSAGVGIIPQMKDGYYNVVGNTVFETIFDNLQDGEYTKKPINFGGAFCFFKRLENYSVTDNDKDLREFIKKEKSMKKGGEINEKNN